jgi:hypothetical protein
VSGRRWTGRAEHEALARFVRWAQRHGFVIALVASAALIVGIASWYYLVAT